MYLCGFADEAARSIEDQIKATKQLGWQHISIRGIDGINLHELEEKKFDFVFEKLQEAGIKVAELGSLIGNWGKDIRQDFQITLDEVARAIARMQKLGCNLVRIMSYKQEPWGQEQYEQERFRRLREITKRFNEVGLSVGHENCMNWGGFSAHHSLRLIEEVPNMKLIFDTGNPVFQRDRSKQEPFPWQNAYQFYQAVKEHIVHIQIKDCIMRANEGEPDYVVVGQGDACVEEILLDLKKSGYDGGIAIEPHVATVFHRPAEQVNWQDCYDSYINYGKTLEKNFSKN